jgi:hypothetical protein
LNTSQIKGKGGFVFSWRFMLNFPTDNLLDLTMLLTFYAAVSNTIKCLLTTIHAML